MLRVAEGLYQLEAGRSVNAYLIEGSSDLTLVDSCHSRAAAGLLAEIKDNGFSSRDIGRVVLTHAHADHVGGVEALLKDHPVKVFAHPGDIPVLSGKISPPGFKGLRGFLMDFYHSQLIPWRPLENVLPVEEGTPLRGIPQWQILHTPGHTGGSLSLFHPVRQILICGDVFRSVSGQLRLAEEYANQDPAALAQSVEKLAKLDCDMVCCGHGGVLRGGAFRYIEALRSRKRSH